MNTESRIDQRAWGQTRSAELLADSVRVSFSAFGQSSDYHVRYEDVFRTPIRFTERREGGQIPEGILWGLASLFLFILLKEWDSGNQLGAFVLVGICAAAAAFIRLARYVPRRDLVQLSSSEPALVLFTNRPSNADVDEFVAALLARSEEYLRLAYGSAAPHESKASQIERLVHLKEQGALSESEFEALKSELVNPATSTRSGTYI